MDSAFLKILNMGLSASWLVLAVLLLRLALRRAPKWTRCLLWALVATSVLGIVAAPVLVWLLGSGLSERSFDASVVMTRFMFPYIGCMSLVALSAGILNTWRRFVVPAASPVLLNLSMIGAPAATIPSRDFSA